MASTVNSGFSKVENSASPFKTLHASTGKLQTLEVGGDVVLDGFLRTSKLWTKTVVGYAPKSFATAASATTLSLLNVPGAAAAVTASDDRLVTLPQGAVVSEVVTDNLGTTVTGGTDFDLGTADFNTSSATLLDGTTLALVNSGVSRNLVGPLTTVTGTASTVVATAPANVLTLTVNSTANTTGDFRCFVTYQLFEY